MKKITLITLIAFVVIFSVACHRPSNLYGENATTKSQEEIDAESQGMAEMEELMNNPPYFTIPVEDFKALLEDNNYEVSHLNGFYKCDSKNNYFNFVFTVNENGLGNLEISIDDIKPLKNEELKGELLEFIEMVFKAIDSNEYNPAFIEDMLNQISSFKDGECNNFIYKNNIHITGGILFEKTNLRITPQKVE